MDFIAVGDNCADVYVPGGQTYAGGCSLNFSVYISQLGGSASYLGAVGDDKLGRLIREAVSKEGVDISHLHTIPGATARTVVSLEGGERKFMSYDPGVLSEFRPNGDDLAFIRQHKFLHTSVFGGMDCILGEVKGDVKICYDFANKLTRPDLNDILKITDIAFFSYQEDDCYIRELLAEAVRQGAVCAVATLGENGSLAFDGKRYTVRPGDQIRVVDTIGAGDSFIAGFLYGCLLGESMEKRLLRGAKRAEKTISHFGAF